MPATPNRGGRIAGQPNKRTLLTYAGVKSVMDLCRSENGKTPAEVLAETMRLNYGIAAAYQANNVEAIRNNSTTQVDRLNELLARACLPAAILMEYLYPKQARVQFMGVPDIGNMEPGAPANDAEGEPADGAAPPRGRRVVFELRLDGARAAPKHSSSQAGSPGARPGGGNGHDGHDDPDDAASA